MSNTWGTSIELNQARSVGTGRIGGDRFHRTRPDPNWGGLSWGGEWGGWAVVGRRLVSVIELATKKRLESPVDVNDVAIIPAPPHRLDRLPGADAHSDHISVQHRSPLVRRSTCKLIRLIPRLCGYFATSPSIRPQIERGRFDYCSRGLTAERLANVCF